MDSLKLSTSQFGRFLRATPIKIFVGSEKTVYHVHPEVLLACNSSTASVRINGSWKDVGDGAIDWTDFDEQTIECVLHYLYTGDYHTPVTEAENPGHISEWVKNCPEQTEGTEQPSAAEPSSAEPSSAEPFAAPQSSLTEAVPLGRPLTPLHDFVDVGFPTTQKETAAGLVAQTDFTDFKPGEYAIGVAVLTHARVYSFAHRHFFPDLARFALQRLTQTLCLAPCNSGTLFPYLGDAIRHVYDTTPGPEIQEDPARKLLSHYFALNYTNLAGKDLCALVEEGGELMIDISNKLVRLLTAKISQVRSLETRIGGLSADVAEFQVICNEQEKEIQQIQESRNTEERGALSSKVSKKKKSLY